MPEHALLSASSAHRWLACPPSARLEETFPDTESLAAAEGTLAHEIAADCLTQFIENGKNTDPTEEQKSNPLYRPVMLDHVTDYALYVMDAYYALKARDPFTTIYVEKRVSYDPIAPEGFGTSDCFMIGDGILHVFDLKYGKGVSVSAIENEQMRLYALGAKWTFPAAIVDLVRMTVYQPRIDNITTDEIRFNDLLAWGINHVQPRARLAWEGKGQFNPGEHCRFCRAETTCAARAKHQMDLAAYEFREAVLLTPEEIGDILARVDDLARWAKSIKDYALKQATVFGQQFGGWKLVEGRSNRIIKDPAAALQRLLDAGYGYDQVVDLVGLTTLEEIVGKTKLQRIIGDLVEKPSGKPALARETDPRPVYSGAANDFKINDFKE